MPDHHATSSGTRSIQRQESAWIRRALITAAVAIIGLLIVVPMVNVFAVALSDGFGAYWDALTAEPLTRHSIMMTLLIAPAAVALNTVFGLSAAWAIARFRFPGRTLLTTLIDLPFSISPVVAGLMLVLLFGRQGILGGWFAAHGIAILFNWPALIIATSFVTLPFVARELIPVMEAIGPDEEMAAVSLGANSWQLFWQVTLPNIKWGLLYGVILCSARAMGEYGAVYVVSGHVRSRATMPLRVEDLFQDFDLPKAYAVASLLTSLALVTLVLKVTLQRITRRQLAAAAQAGPEDTDTLHADHSAIARPHFAPPGSTPPNDAAPETSP